MRRQTPTLALMAAAFDRASPGDAPLYRRLATAIEQSIQAGHLAVGQRLPAERVLAADLGLSRTTVTAAYKELEARGLLRGYVSRGTVVIAAPSDGDEARQLWAGRASRLALLASDVLTLPKDGADTVSFANARPDPSLYPLELLDAAAEELLRRGTAALYAAAPVEGDAELRARVAARLRQRGISVPADQVLITSGAQEGLNLLARAFLLPADVVLAERPTWMGAVLAFRWAGAEVVGVDMDEEGIVPEALEEALVRHRPKLLYLIPTFHNPTGVVLGGRRRRRVLELAMTFQVPIVESDLCGQLHFETVPPPPLRALDANGIVTYQGSISKVLVPGLRIGWLVAPPGPLALLRAAKKVSELTTATLSQRLVAHVLGSHGFDRHLVSMRRELRLRRDVLVQALRRDCPPVRFQVPPGGHYLWAALPPPLAAHEFVLHASRHGVALRPEAQFMPDGRGNGHVRFAFSGLAIAAVREGSRRLAEALQAALDVSTTSLSRQPGATDREPGTAPPAMPRPRSSPPWCCPR